MREKEQEQDKIKRAIVEIAETEQGQIFFHWLANSCFFSRSTIESNPSAREINPLGTVYNEARRRLYLDIRRAIPKALLRKIENT